MTDIYIDGTISEKVYDENAMEFTHEFHILFERRHRLEESIDKQKELNERKLV